MWRRDWGGGKPTQIYPLQDLREHVVEGTECWCEPYVEPGEGNEILVIHNAADERERFERGERKTS